MSKLNLKVMVEDDWVTQPGDVHWQHQKQAAAEFVHNLMGMNGVNNEISVKPATRASAIATKIAEPLERRYKEATSRGAWRRRHAGTNGPELGQA